MNNTPQSNEELSIADVVRRELKNDVTDKELQVLKDNPNIWRSELIVMKLSCESQMTAAKARRFQIHSKWVRKDLNNENYSKLMNDERTWQCNAGRLLQQIETKILHVNNYE